MKDSNTKSIKLTQGRFAILDDYWFSELSKYKWYIYRKKNGKCYAFRLERLPNKKSKTVLMHRVIMNAQKGVIIDHIDGDGLNNHPNNLRIATNSQNLMNRGKTSKNTSGFKGVHWNKGHGKWQAQINVGGKHKSVGFFTTKELAYEAYCEACNKYHGEFAHF